MNPLRRFAMALKASQKPLDGENKGMDNYIVFAGESYCLVNGANTIKGFNTNKDHAIRLAKYSLKWDEDCDWAQVYSVNETRVVWEHVGVLEEE